MIELPEAVVLAGQIRENLVGRRILAATRGNTPHKFAFYSLSPEEYAATLAGRQIVGAGENGSFVLMRLSEGWTLILGGGGERIRHHLDTSTLPARHHLLLEFDDGTCLTVTVQGWGAVQLVPDEQEEATCCSALDRVSPLGAAFTLERFQTLFEAIGPADPLSVKAFLISKPGMPGVGNGYAQDILFHARLNPRHRVATLSLEQRRILFTAIRDTLKQAVTLGGRDTEFDLYGRSGDYRPQFDRYTADCPCPSCGGAIKTASYLGGTVYFCPVCQE